MQGYMEARLDSLEHGFEQLLNMIEQDGVERA